MPPPGAETDPRPWTSSTLVGLPAHMLAGTAFNADPTPLHVAGARESHPGLFALLASCDGAEQARSVYSRYMDLTYGLAAGRQPGRWHTSYLKLLQGWGLDANGASGAVLKGWAESRFGIAPVFHRGPMARFPSPAWMHYLQEKAGSRFHNNDIYQQLDLLFEFSQWMLQRYQALGAGRHVTLWRGSTRCEEQVVQGSLRERRCTVRLNNIVSFSRSREQAGCFGDWLLRAEVPLCKLLLWPGLLDTSTLQGESEVLAIGGDYEVQASYD